MHSIHSIGVFATILATQLQRFAKSPSTIVWLMGLPFLIILTLGLTLRSGLESEFVPYRPFRVAVAWGASHVPGASHTPGVPGAGASSAPGASREPGESTSALARELRSALGSNPTYFDLAETQDEAAARKGVLAQEVDAAVIVPGDFPYEPVTIISGPHSMAAGMIEGVAENLLVKWALGEVGGESPAGEAASGEVAAGAAGVFIESLPVAVDVGGDTASRREPFFGVGAFQYFSVTIASLFAMFAAHTAMTDYAGDRASGVYTRVRASGVSRRLYLFAGFANAAVRCVAFLGCLALLTGLLFGVRWGNWAAWSALTVFAGASLAGLSLTAMAVAPTRESVEPIGNLIFQVMGFLGGSTLPLHLYPEWLLSLFRWLPNRAMIEGYFALAKGAGLADIRHEILALAGAALVLSAAGWTLAYIYRKGDERR